jgi:membrane associated rhomboid family serine protease
MKNGFLTAPDFWTWFGQARLLIDLLVVMWIVALINFSLLPGALSAIGALKPRSLFGLPGIFLSSFLHADWQHLLGNSAYHLIFGGMIIFRDARDLPIVTISSAILNGGLLWLFGRKNGYVGASGVIFGYIGFVVSLIYFYRDTWAIIFFTLILLSLFFGDLIVFPALTGSRKWVFGRTLWGMFPRINGRVAWEGHLIGFIAGIWTASRLNDLHNFFQPIFQWFGNDLVRFIQ